MNIPIEDDTLWPVYEFRPEGFYERKRKWLRYAEGAWIEDDGEWDISFITDDPGAPFHLEVSLPYRSGIVWQGCTGHWSGQGPKKHPGRNAWHYMLRDGYKDFGDSWARDRHPNESVSDIAARVLCERYSCANGRGPEFHMADPWIKAGLLRRADTKEVVRFPEKFVCTYCGEVTGEWEH